MDPSASDQANQPVIPRAVALTLAALGGLVIAATVGLWAYYGKTVFFEMIVAGFSACF